MNKKSFDLGWAIGLLEGEGCFHSTNSPGVRITMTDEDALVKIAKILGGKVDGPYPPRTHQRKATWNWVVYGDPAIEIMRKIHPHMGIRRQSQIDKVLTWAASRPGTPRGVRVKISKLNPIAVNVIRYLWDRARRGDKLKIARAYGVCHGTVQNAGERKTWKHVPEAVN